MEKQNNFNNKMENINQMNKMFYDENISIPERLLPQNIKKRLEDLDETEVMEARKRVEKDFSRRSQVIRRSIAGGAVAAACIAAIVFVNGSFKGTKTLEPINLSDNPGTTHIASSTIETNSTRSDGKVKTDNYNAAYASMKKYNEELSKMRERGSEDIEYYNDATTDSYISDVAMKYPDGAANSGSSSSTAKIAYSETNIRTLGVDEGDIVKTDGTHIYVLNNNLNTLTVYLANNGKPKKISTISLKYKKDNMDVNDMYVHGNKLVITANNTKNFTIAQIKELYKNENSNYKNYNKKSWNNSELRGTCGLDDSYSYNTTGSYTITFIYDLSKVDNPKLLHEFFQDGGYNSSRMVDGILYLFSNRSFNPENIDKKDSTSYIPQVGGECVSDFDVLVQNKTTGTEYTVISSIDTGNCEYIGKQAVLNGASNRLYVSSKNIYLFGEKYFQEDFDTKSTIIKLSYDNGEIKKAATGSFKGNILDDYCIDEKDGLLRFVTTYYTKKGNERNGLFIMDKNLEVTGKITNLAKNEEIYSARFIDNTAYFVTYRNTDPLFAVDVSNPVKPKMLGYLKIPGFSRYLHPYADNLLLGIGEETDTDGNTLGIKMSMFDISNPADIKEVAKKVIEGDYFEAEYNPNALFIDTSNNIFGFGFDKRISSPHSKYGYVNKIQYKYVVYSYNDKKGFVTKLNYDIEERRDVDAIMYETKSRGIYIGEYFYIVSVNNKNKIKSFDLKSFKKY